MNYKEKLLDPRWQKLRLRVFERDGWKCVECGNSKITLHVHHEEYNGDPWSISIDKLRCLCSTCHNKKHSPPPPSLEAYRAAWKQTMDRINEPGAKKHHIHVWKTSLIILNGEVKRLYNIDLFQESNNPSDNGREQIPSIPVLLQGMDNRNNSHDKS